MECWWVWTCRCNNIMTWLDQTSGTRWWKRVRTITKAAMVCLYSPPLVTMTSREEQRPRHILSVCMEKEKRRRHDEWMSPTLEMNCIKWKIGELSRMPGTNIDDDIRSNVVPEQWLPWEISLVKEDKTIVWSFGVDDDDNWMGTNATDE